MTEAHVQEIAQIGQRHIWHYLISTNIGDFHVIEHEDSGLGLVRDLLTDDNDKAERGFRKAVKNILNGSND